jgi:hypothetical protein
MRASAAREEVWGKLRKKFSSRRAGAFIWSCVLSQQRGELLRLKIQMLCANAGYAQARGLIAANGGHASLLFAFGCDTAYSSKS